MPTTLDEWSDHHWELGFARQTSQLETVKLVVTFSLGISATIVAAALQAQSRWWLDLLAAIALAGAFILTVVTLNYDRLTLPDLQSALDLQARDDWSDAKTLDWVRTLARNVKEPNAEAVRLARRLAEAQLAMSCTAATCAAISMFN